MEYSETTQFPVLADPSWMYAYDFAATNAPGNPLYDVNHPKQLDSTAFNLLQQCFNCNFPIGGAPAIYPYDGQYINLNASPFSFITVPAPVVKWTFSVYGMELVAQPGHFDGGGSSIIFNWWNDSSGYLHLYVQAYVVVDNGGPANAVNTLVAGTNWLNFWRNVANSTASGGGGV